MQYATTANQSLDWKIREETVMSLHISQYQLASGVDAHPNLGPHVWRAFGCMPAVFGGSYPHLSRVAFSIVILRTPTTKHHGDRFWALDVGRSLVRLTLHFLFHAKPAWSHLTGHDARS